MNAEYQVQIGHHTFKRADESFSLPKKSEVEEMLNGVKDGSIKYCFDEKEYEGVFIYPCGREIRLPAAGFVGEDGGACLVRQAGYYWLIDDKYDLIGSEYPYYLWFISSSAHICHNLRKENYLSVYAVPKN